MNEEIENLISNKVLISGLIKTSSLVKLANNRKIFGYTDWKTSQISKNGIRGFLIESKTHTLSRLKLSDEHLALYTDNGNVVRDVDVALHLAVLANSSHGNKFNDWKIVAARDGRRLEYRLYSFKKAWELDYNEESKEINQQFSSINS